MPGSIILAMTEMILFLRPDGYCDVVLIFPFILFYYEGYTIPFQHILCGIIGMTGYLIIYLLLLWWILSIRSLVKTDDPSIWYRLLVLFNWNFDNDGNIVWLILFIQYWRRTILAPILAYSDITDWYWCYWWPQLIFYGLRCIDDII